MSPAVFTWLRADVGQKTSHNVAGHSLPKTNTQPLAFEFPLQTSSGGTMKDLIERNRAGALVELELAIDVTEIALRDSHAQTDREYSYSFLQRLKDQREPEVRHVRIGRGAA